MENRHHGRHGDERGQGAPRHWRVAEKPREEVDCHEAVGDVDGHVQSLPARRAPGVEEVVPGGQGHDGQDQQGGHPEERERDTQELLAGQDLEEVGRLPAIAVVHDAGRVKDGQPPRGHAEVAAVVDEVRGRPPEPRERAQADGGREEEEGQDGAPLNEEDVHVEAPEQQTAQPEPDRDDYGKDEIESPLRRESHGCIRTRKAAATPTMRIQAIQM